MTCKNNQTGTGRQIKFTIESKLENVSFIGVSVNRICSFISLSDNDSYGVELCTVEAVNNCIEHSYMNKSGNEIDVVFSLSREKIIIDIYDTGIAMDSAHLDHNDQSNPCELENTTEHGRGVSIMKEIMDSISYKTIGDKNCLTLEKKIKGSLNSSKKGELYEV